jgi:hypothetical protein
MSSPCFPFFSTAIDTTEDNILYRFVPESSAVSDDRWTWATRETLADEFPDGTSDLIGQWDPWKRPK